MQPGIQSDTGLVRPFSCRARPANDSVEVLLKPLDIVAEADTDALAGGKRLAGRQLNPGHRDVDQVSRECEPTIVLLANDFNDRLSENSSMFAVIAAIGL